MIPRFALLSLIALPLAACDEAAMKDFRAGLGMDTKEEQPEEPAKPRPPAVSPLDVPIETGASDPVAAITAEATTLNTTAYAARGNEPFWLIQVQGNTAIYKTPENQSGRSITVQRLIFAQGVEYVGTVNGQVFALNIRGSECTDSMSGEKFPMTATLKIGNNEHRGCAVPAEPATTGG